MIEPITDFARRFQAEIKIDTDFVVKTQDRYFLLDENLKKLVAKGFFYAGVYLGKTKEGRFFPSFNLLRMLAHEKANKVIVDKKTAWLFICRRDVFGRGIIEVIGSHSKKDCTLVLNEYGECLGFGRILCDLHDKQKGVVVKNISDIGDFLRREDSC